MPELLAGIARATITPPVGIPMIGFAGRGPAASTHDDLTATALVLGAGEQRAVIVAADVLWFPDAFAREVRAGVEASTGIPAVNVLLCASHTHYGPEMGPNEAGAEPESAIVRAYLANLQYLLMGAVRQAAGAMRQVRIGVGRGESHIGVNRRERKPDGSIVLGQNPAGPCDAELIVVRLDIEEDPPRPLAAILNFACHPVSAAHAMAALSADYIGAARCLLESETGTVCVFLQGAAGNINPVEMRHSFEPARRLGAMFGGEALKVFENSLTAPSAGLAAATHTIELPAMRFDSGDQAEREVAARRAEAERLAAEDASEGSVWWARRRLERAEAMRNALESGTPLPPIRAELAALRFGDVVLATSPGEIFTETGMAVKQRTRQAAHATLFAGYTNGSIGYVPVPSAFLEGGYEVTHACRVAPEAAGIVEDTAVELVEQLARP